MAKKKASTRKRITVVERKLGKERAQGLAYYDYYGEGKSLIEIDPRQNSKEYLDTLIDEALHTIFPDMKEKKVASIAGRLTRVLWRQGYRRIQD